MKISTIIRILNDHYRKRPIRQSYWELSKKLKGAVALFFHRDQNLRLHFRADFWRYVFRAAAPVKGQTIERMHAAANWLLLAQASTPDDGVSLGYFPLFGQYAGWHASYPETTGYIMTTLFKYADRFDIAIVREAAIRMGKWESRVQMPSGAVQGGEISTPEKQTAAAFNTGMVLDGWCSAYEISYDRSFLDAARKAADFLVNDVDENGYFKTNGGYVSSDKVKTYTCLCAWSIYRFGSIVKEHGYYDAAIRIIEAALRKQQANGWFGDNCLTNPNAPLTHTIGYTLQAIFEVGALVGREDFIQAAISGIDPILEKIDSRGYLPGRFYSDWEPAVFWSCLTGNAQIAIVCYRLAEHTGILSYREKADKLVNYLKSLQVLDAENPALNGAIGGSFPLIGDYMYSGYPNWATKYFLDALALQDDQHT